MASVLFVLNDAPYGTERSYNALRHALAMSKAGHRGEGLPHGRRHRLRARRSDDPRGLLLHREPAQRAPRQEVPGGLMRHLHGRPWFGIPTLVEGAVAGLSRSARPGRSRPTRSWSTSTAGRAGVAETDRIDPKILEMHAKVCRTMAHPLRLALMNALRDGERTVGDLAEAVGATQPLVSQHLGALRDQGLLRTRRTATRSTTGSPIRRWSRRATSFGRCSSSTLRSQEQLARLEDGQSSHNG